MATVNYFDWNMGVTDDTLHKGIIKNTNYIAGSGLKKYFSGDQEFSFSEDDDPIKNYQILEGSLLPAGNTLDVEIIPSTGSDTYTLKDCYDIKHVARYIKSGIETVISTSEIKIPFGPFTAISNYDSRFTTNNLGGILACRITNTSTNDKYLRSFTISGNNIILRDINPDTSGVYQISGITGISTSWRFELISAFDIVKSGTELESVFQGYVIKTIENGEGTIKFTKYDAPEKADNEFIAITYIKLQSIKPQEVNMVSILQHDIYTDPKKIDFALTQSQLDLLKENLLKYINPLKKVVLKTRRPTVLKRGDEVYFKVTDVIEDILKVVDYSEDYIHKNGELNNKPFKEITYIFANYFDDFAKLLSTFQLKDEINKIQLAKKQKFNYLSEIIISCTNQLNTDGNAIFVSKPIFTGYEFTNVNSEPQDNNLTITWQTVPEATNYYIEISLNDTFTHLISAGNTGNYTEISTYSDFTINNNNFYARLKAEKNGLFSDWSTVLEINKSNLVEKIIYSEIAVNGNYRLVKANNDNTNKVYLTPDSYTSLHPRVSHDGKKIVFTKEYSASKSDLMILDLVTNTITNLTNFATNNNYVWNPSFNNDDTKILYAYHAGSRSATAVIKEMTIATLSSATLYTASGTTDNISPEYNTDNTKLYFSNTSGLVLFDIATTGITIIDAGNEYFATQHPTLNKIIYSSSVGGINYKLVERDLDINTVTEIYPAYSYNMFARYSPDGNSVIWSSLETGIWQIKKKNLITNAIVNLTSGSVHNLYPEWANILEAN